MFIQNFNHPSSAPDKKMFCINTNSLEFVSMFCCNSNYFALYCANFSAPHTFNFAKTNERKYDDGK